MHPDLTQVLITDLRLAPEDLRPEAGLEEAGLDSLGITELCMVAAERWDLTLGEEELAGITTLGALDRLITQRREGQ